MPANWTLAGLNEPLTVVSVINSLAAANSSEE